MTDADPAPLGRRGAYAKGVARREEILDRAIEVFQKRGADETSLRRIAESIGVSHAALLHYFDSRQQLLIAVYDRAEAARSADPATPKAERGVDVMVLAAMANVRVPGLVELYSTLVAASLEADNPQGKAYFRSRFERVRSDLAERFREEQQAGRIRGDVDCEQIAALVVAASDGLQIQWLLEPSIQLEETLRTFAVLLQP